MAGWKAAIPRLTLLKKAAATTCAKDAQADRLEKWDFLPRAVLRHVQAVISFPAVCNVNLRSTAGICYVFGVNCKLCHRLSFARNITQPAFCPVPDRAGITFCLLFLLSHIHTPMELLGIISQAAVNRATIANGKPIKIDQSQSYADVRAEAPPADLAFIGNRIVKVEPCPGADSTSIAPWCRAIISRVMASPSPVPPCVRVLALSPR